MSSKPRTSSRPSASSSSSSAPVRKASRGDESDNSNNSGDEIRILLDWHHVGAIIGKGGAQVKTLREESGCAINIIAPAPNAPSPQQIDRVMTVKGSIEQATKAIYLIAETIQARAAERKKSGQDSGDRRQGQEPQDGTTSIKLLVHRAAVGAVIGKGGEAIRSTQADTGARIQVSSEPLGNSTDKTITLSGTPDVVETAVRTVLNQLAESPLRAGTKTAHFVPGPSFYDYPNESQQSSNSSSAPVNTNAGAAAASGPISIQKIAIPTICAGCVIGRGGSIIRDLRSQSGTNISIADPDPATPDERVVTITGTPQGIQTAVYLIRQCVESYVPPAQGEEEQHTEEHTEEQQ